MSLRPLPPLLQLVSQLELVSDAVLLKSYQAGMHAHTLVLALIADKLISSKEYCHAMARHFGVELLDLSYFELNALPVELVSLSLIQRHFVLPLHQQANTLVFASIDLKNKAAIDELKFYTGLNVQLKLVDPIALDNAIKTTISNNETSINNFWKQKDISKIVSEDKPHDFIATNNSHIERNDDDRLIVQYVDKVMRDAIKRKASDIHVEPYANRLRLRYRIDGILHEMASQPIELAARITVRIKIMAKLDIAERRIPQDGRIKYKIDDKQEYDFRISTLPTIHGEKLVVRILDSGNQQLNLADLGFSERQLKIYVEAIQKPYGMVLITGPTGSGKTVTLYSALRHLNNTSKNISTVEDPVEIQLDGVTQVNINERANLGFANVLRAFLRQDPDIIMLGEIRDLETAEIAIKAAQTGHLVLSTLHTNTAQSTVTRLLNMDIPAFNIASSVQLIITQRLVRKLCEHCKKITVISGDVFINAGLTTNSLGTFKANKDGCEQCTLGYKGRTGVYQVLPIDEQIKTLILEGGTELDIETAALQNGVCDLYTAGLMKVASGITSLNEVKRLTFTYSSS